MLKRRLLAAVAALLMASVGALLLFSYVKGADNRAMAGMETANVLVATALIPKGTAAESLGKLIAVRALPVKALATGTMPNLEAIRGQVSTADLQPGEQLLGSRFANPASLEDQDDIKVPAGMQQVSIPMERPRMLGAMLTPGSTVGVFVSMTKEGDQPAVTHLVLHQVLVIQVGEPEPSPPADGDAEPAKAADPADLVLVTFAVKARDAEKLVFGAEHGRLWLSLEPSNAVTSGTQVVNPGNVFAK